ncbi:hypothetical protein BXZ70DRAFT_579056 [Cristinia sonorae]|uniref:Uncharacterized protein n=1 Tax=Cristinia sonorae TaxID=1940300 RepID=A0A8K0UG44_9AGAR|nr:hypothetical protein BXZ70DRAFT_579056 [Cristinia sonorae]
MHRPGFYRGPTSSMLYAPEDDFHKTLDEKLELLHQLEDTTWNDDHSYPPSDSDATASSVNLPFEDEEENDDACEACVYDPYLFAPSSPTRGTIASGIVPFTSDREKPLPSPPLFQYRQPPPPPPPTPGYYSPVPSPPSTPQSLTFSSSASSSPRLPHTPPRPPFLLSAPRPRTRSNRMSVGSTRSTLTHSPFPSISSTLSHLEDRETEVEKRSGVYVTDAERGAEQRTDETLGDSSAVIRGPVRKTSKELLKLQSFVAVADTELSLASRKASPTLSTSHSSPQLRTLADLAATPASPLRTASPASTLASTSTQTARTHTLTRSHTFPSPLDDFGCDNPPMSPSSRWSIDSTRSGQPLLPSVAENSPSDSPAKPRKRDRLISFISRNRTGSVGKAPSSPSSESEFADLIGFQPEFFVGSSRRSSKVISQPSSSSLHLPIQQPTDITPPLPISTSSSTSSASSSSTLPTPVDGNSSEDVLPHPSFFSPDQSSYLPEVDDAEYEADMYEPTLPLPSPSVPTASFLIPQRPQSSFPFLSTFRRKTRRHRKLVVNIPPYEPAMSVEEENGNPAAKKLKIEEGQRKRHDAVVRWCESFGPLRRVEKRADGSLHIHWKEWEAADTVCRIAGQVHIKSVGTVSLEWHYLK